MLRSIPALLPQVIRQAWRSHFGSRNARGGWVDTLTPSWVMEGMLDSQKATIPVSTLAVARAGRREDRLTLQFQESVAVVR